ncbi:hypothetical protein [Streptomyces sp. N2A]|uniref:hypothetical protein n=1 Tax=Streptomyces sp. N2A TaxID=3073936 RepID=UPI0028704C19|nr:hypothetical protein [Streptomyces sp. N2A]
MSTTNGHPEDPTSHGRPPAEPPTPDQTATERPSAQGGALGWATIGLTAVFCTTGVVLTLTGHDGAGIALISVCSLGRGVDARK